MREVITSTNLTAADAPLWNTAEHHGSVVSVVTWLLTIATVFVVGARVVTRYATMNTLRADDIMAIFAMVTAIGQSIAVSISSTHGLGSHADNLSPDQRDVIQKALYASLLLYIVTLGLAKSSVCIHLYKLFPYRASRQSSAVMMSLIGIWTVTALLVVAFECKLPTPWSITSSGKCIDLLAFWTYYGIFNIITDTALIALPVSIVIKLQMKASQKAVIIACDASRLSIPRTQTPDLLYDLWVPILLGQTVLFFSLISSCFPFLKFLIDALETGMIRADGLNITHAQLRLPSATRSADGYSKARGSQFQKGPFSFSSNNEAGKTALSASPWSGRMRDTSKAAPENIEMDRIDRGSHWLPNRHCEITAGKKSEDDSQSSQTHIMRKVEWSVTEEKSGVAV
ncbi:MAG: hypothetical protein L6R38_007107 [Xanthoria sp. 2 TBL-2021]|nr:MAG: hypothetical protein L6R38_007107 [Xanthoria sp. 2 TBL-2021]